jgi:phosphohistidine phosphatase SixA
MEWFGIMRHAEAHRPHRGPDEIARGPDGLSRTGIREAAAVADRLAESVFAQAADAPARTIGDIHVLYAPTAPARDTAALVAAAINKNWANLARRAVARAGVRGSVKPAEVRVTKTARLAPDGPGLTSAQVAEKWSEIVGREGPPMPKLVLTIGHDPQVTRRLQGELAAGRTFTRRLATRTSLERGEVAMVRRRDGRTELMWVISPDTTEAIEQLQAKIKSKMDTAKVLGAFLTALFFFAAKELEASRPRPQWYPWAAGAGIALLAFATIAFVVTMFLYDGLLMPVRYWAPMPETEGWLARRRWYRLVGTGQDPRRPPSSAATVMFHGMQRVWSALFVPAAVAAGLGTAATAIAFAKPDGAGWYAVLGSAVGVAVLVTVLMLVGRPQLGTTD